MDERLDGIDARLDRMNVKIDKGFEGVNAKLGAITEWIDAQRVEQAKEEGREQAETEQQDRRSRRFDRLTVNWSTVILAGATVVLVAIALLRP